MIEYRAPAKAKKPAKLKPKPTLKKPAPKKPTSKKPKPTPVGKITKKPTATPTSKLVWPKLKVPHLTKAFDTCDSFIACGGEDHIIAARKANNAEVFRITLAPAPTPLARIEYSVEKRDQRTFKPKEVPALTITSLNYPSSSELYEDKDGASIVEKHALKFASDDVANTEVVDTKKKPTNKEIDGYVTEHIVEVSSALSKR
jgi:hypothetical protein